ncbi:MAG: VWA domain-containing protein [Chloroflexi bacterium]|nr:VWA domain-containing protein [Chloroflexota bacterium]
MQSRLSVTTKIAASHAGAPGLGSWLALLFIGACAMAWVNNEAIVTWALAEGLVEEAATGTLLNAVRYACVGAGALALVGAWRIFAWPAWGVYTWAPAQVVITYGWRRLTPVVRLLRYVGHGAAIVVVYLGRALGTALRSAWKVTVTPLGYALRGLGSLLRYVGHGAATVMVYLGRALGTALRFAWMVTVTPLAYALRGLGAVLRYVGHVAATVVVYLGRALGTALRFAWMVTVTPLGYALRGLGAVLRYVGHVAAIVVVYLGRALGTALRFAWMVTVTPLGYALRGLGAVLRYVGRGVAALRYLWTAVAVTVHFLWEGVTTIAQAISLVLRFMGVGFARALRYLGLRGATILRPFWLGVASILHYLWAGVSTIGLALGLALHYLGLGVSTILHYLQVVASAIALAVGLVLRHLYRPVSMVIGYLWLSLSTLALLLAWMWSLLWQGMTGALRGVKRGGLFVMRTAWTGFGAMPDVGRTVVWVARHRKGVSEMSNSKLNRQRVLSLIAVLWVLGIAGFFAARAVWPPPPEPTVEVVHWTNGHLMRTGLLPEMSTQFNQAGHRTQSGKRIVVAVHDVPSELQAEYLVPRVKSGTRIDLSQLSGGYVAPNVPDPTIVTPSDAHWMVTVNHEVGHDVVDLKGALGIVRPVVGIVTYEAMARCLGWPDKEIGYADVIALRNDPRGWASHPDCARAEWGQQPLVAFTDPTTSSTGRSLLFGLYSIAAGKPPEELTPDDVSDPAVVAYVKQFQGLVDHYLIGTTVLNTKVHQGPRYGHFFIMPEDNLIHLYDGTERAFVNGKRVTPPPIAQGSMVMIYPKEGSMPRGNCACIVQADWVTQEQVEAAQKWIAFIREDQQQRAFMAAGFRPGTDISLKDPSSKINGEFGLDPTKPTVWLYPSLIQPAVAAAIDDSWELVKRPGIVTFVVDTSGSMLGTKIEQARDGLVRALDNMAKNNQVGLLTFSNTVNTRIAVAPLVESRFAIADVVHKMGADGGTALYDAISAGIEMTDGAEGEADAIRAVVVLTDGRANRGQTKLHDLIQMSSRDEVPIPVFGGLENETSAVAVDGRPIDKASIVGDELAVKTTHPIQVFFIGIGDADLDIGRILSQATGAEFQGATEDDLANVLEEFSKYF